MALVSYELSDTEDDGESLTKTYDSAINNKEIVKTVDEKNNAFNVIGTICKKKHNNERVKIMIPPINYLEEEHVPTKMLKFSFQNKSLYTLLPPPKNIYGNSTSFVPYSLKAKPQQQENIFEEEIDRPKHNFCSTNLTNSKSLESCINYSYSAPNTLLPPPKNGNSTSFVPYSLKPKPQQQKIILEEEIERPKHSVFPNNLTNSKSLENCINYSYSAPKNIEINSAMYVEDNQSTTNNINQNKVIPTEGGEELFGRNNKYKSKLKIGQQMIDVDISKVIPDRSILRNNGFVVEHQAPTVKKIDEPSFSHRRKHQITYLAYQAKINEQELKNQWAVNRLTRKQTQAKYGF